ncbi:MAG TPA: hypothetical protein DD782_04545 [Firmicutes bacterium]|mgnify:FL=1|nr:hypothetical protein [Bacillota bacterium]
MKRLLPIPIMLAMLLSASLTAAAFVPQAGLDWQVITTKHFIFYFDSATEQLARHVAGHAEAIHDRLTEELQITLSEKTHVIVMDEGDVFNGMATPTPRQKIVLYSTSDYAPGGEFGVSESAILDVFCHEYVHMLQMSYAPKGPAFLNRIIGWNLFIPNVALPMWSIEGLAVYQESLFSEAGRLNSSTWEMYIRADYLENQLLTLDQVWAGPYRWPYGNSYYLYGSFFTEYLADRFGRDKLAEFYHATAEDIPIVQFKSTFKKIYQHKFSDVVDDWYDFLAVKFEADKATITAAGLMEGQRLSHTGGITGYGVFAPDGSLYYSSYGIKTLPALRRTTPDYTSSIKVNNLRMSHMALSRDGKMLAFDMTGATPSSNFIDDLYTLNLENGKIQRLTTDLRAKDPSWSPDGTAIAFVRNSPPNYSLAILNVTDGTVRDLINSNESRQAFAPSWSPIDQRIAYARFESRAEGVRLYIFNVDNGTEQRLNSDLGRAGAGAGVVAEFDPVWSPDGRYIYYTADYTGVYNIYAHDTTSGAVFQVTNVLTGAYAPDVSSDGQVLAYTGFTADGYDQFVMPLDPHKFRLVSDSSPAAAAQEPVDQQQETQQVAQQVAAQESGFFTAEFAPLADEAQPYSAWSTLCPMFAGPSGYYFPSGAYRIGLSVMGMDVLDTANYSLTAFWSDGGPGYAANVNLRTKHFDLGLFSNLDYAVDDGWVSEKRVLQNGVTISDSGKGLFSPRDSWLIGLGGSHRVAWSLSESSGTASTSWTQNFGLNYGIVQAGSGPVDLRRGWQLAYGFDSVYTPANHQFDYLQNVKFSAYVPLYDAIAFSLTGAVKQSNAALAGYDFAVPGAGTPRGNWLWEGSAALEAPLMVVERGFMVFPLYWHGLNLYSALNIGQVLEPTDAFRSVIDAGLVLRLQISALPIDIYGVASYSLTPSSEPWGFSVWFRL